MKDRADRQKKKTGAFTLAEFLVVIAIITILAGVSFVGGIQYQRRLRRMEMDRTAKELFLAAQNQLSLETASGSIERLLAQNPSGSDDKLGTSVPGSENEGLYYILYQSGAASDDNHSIRERLLPFGTIDETVRTDGNYIIIYEPKAGLIRKVWYSDQYAFAATDLNATGGLADAETSPEMRERFGDKEQPIGYYAGDTIQSPEIAKPESIEKPTLKVINGDILYADVDTNKQEGVALRLWVEGVSSRAKGYIALDGSGSNRIIDVAISGKKLIILDDIFMSDKHFSKLSDALQGKENGENKNFIPGEDILVYVEAYTSESSVISDIHRTNSLFQKVVNNTIEVSSIRHIEVSSIRHLENLDQRVSKFNMEQDGATLGLSPTAEEPKTYSVVQTADMSWITYCDRVAAVYNENTKATYEGKQITISYSDIQSQPGCFVPLYPQFSLSYDGQGHAIADLQAKALLTKSGKNQKFAIGLFGEVIKNLTVRNLKLVRPDITSPTCAGALIGRVKDSETTNVLAEDILVQYPMIVSDGNKQGTSSDLVDAGALIGAFEGANLTVKRVMASNTDLTTTLEQSGTQEDSAENIVDTKKLRILALSGAAGGLIGSAKRNVTLSSCVSSVYVYGGDLAGGLVAHIKTTGTVNRVLIENSYVSGHTDNGVFQPRNDADPSSDDFFTLDAEKNKFDAKDIPYNIVSKTAAGGLAAVLPADSTIKHAYVTASIWSKGLTFDGDFKDNTDLNLSAEENLKKRKLETAFVANTINANNKDGISASKMAYCYSASVVRGVDLNAEKVWDYDSDTLKDYFKVSYPERGKQAFPYDETLKTEEGSQKERNYPMPTVIELVQLDPAAKQQIAAEAGPDNAEKTKQFSKFVRVHVGDWLDPSLNDNLEGSLTFYNGNQLWVDYEMKKPQKPEVQTEADTQYLTLSVQGETSKQTVYYILKSTDQYNTISYYEDILPEKIAEAREKADWGSWKPISDMNPKRLEVQAVGIGNARVRIRLYLDDRSVPSGGCEYLHMAQTDEIGEESRIATGTGTGTIGTGTGTSTATTPTGKLIPGENLIVRVSRTRAIPDETKEVSANEEQDLIIGNDEKNPINSCFASLKQNADQTYTAEIANARHLMNLGVCDQSELKITKAKQTENIFWQEEDSEVAKKNNKNTPYCKEIKENRKGEAAVADVENRFEPIENKTLQEYDGNKKTIANLKILPQQSENKKIDHEIPSALFINNWNLSVHDLNMKDPDIRGSKSAAAILAFSDDEQSGSGEIGTSVSSTLNFSNIKVYGDKLRIRGTEKKDSCVGGILSSATVDNLTMSKVYVYAKTALIDRMEDDSVRTGTDETNYGNAATGGLIGSVTVNNHLKIEHSMFSGYLDGRYSEDTGGLIGRLEVGDKNNDGPAKEYSISACYVAGRNDSYLKDDAEESTEGNFSGNICITGKHHIGGLLGYVDGQVKVEKSFSMAGIYGYAKGNSDRKEDEDPISSIGGLVGYCKNSDKLSLSNDYFGGTFAISPKPDTDPMVGIWVGRMSYSDKTLATGGTISDCSYISKQVEGRNLLGNGTYPDGDPKDNVYPKKEESVNAVEDTETYDLSGELTYPYKIWTEEDGKRTYRGDWYQEKQTTQ